MGDIANENFFDRTLGNLKTAWRDVASGAARTLGLAVPPDAADPETLTRLMKECLQARGGEVSARLRAAELGQAYLESDAAGRRQFLEILAQRFATDDAAVEDAIIAYRAADDLKGRLVGHHQLRRALQPPRVKLLTQFNALPEGVKFLVDLRADLLPLITEDPHLRDLDRDLRELLTSWFDLGFLDLRRITWDSPASLLEKLIAYEAVHEIRSWDDLRNRLDSDRCLFALFHPRMPEEPLAFVEVALVKGLASNVQALLDLTVPAGDPAEADTAIFYSISNTQKGLRGISFGEFLIKRATTWLSHEFPQIRNFATLSPVPGFRGWLEGAGIDVVPGLLTEEEKLEIKVASGIETPHKGLIDLVAKPDWPGEAGLTRILEAPLQRLCARYFLERRDGGLPIDPVARFHLKNGARLERINWLGDTSANGLRQACGMMVNYCYFPEEVEKNHEAFMSEGRLALGTPVQGLLRGWRETNGSPIINRRQRKS
ncbi:MAG: malonyl-CoA decarboxylase [Kiloniellales bacterium]|nr:malonyl-CoA decarboxylase [Kiloniellales bacterium]